NTLTNRTTFGPEGCHENGSFDASLITSRAGQIMISHLNGNFRAIAARRADSLTSSRTTNVPTAPILTISNLANCFPMSPGWDRLRCASQLEADLRKLFGVLSLSGSASGPLEIIAV